MSTNPSLTAERQPDDPHIALRPKSLAEFIGQAAALGTVAERIYT